MISILCKILDHVLFSGIGFTVQVIRQVYDLRVICMWALDLGDRVCWLNSFIFSVSLRLRSVKNIQKITKSMKMVSAAKFGRAERELRPARVYGAGASGVWPVLHQPFQSLEKSEASFYCKKCFIGGVLFLDYNPFLTENVNWHDNQLWKIFQRLSWKNKKYYWHKVRVELQ